MWVLFLMLTCNSFFSSYFEIIKWLEGLFVHGRIKECEEMGKEWSLSLFRSLIGKTLNHRLTDRRRTIKNLIEEHSQTYHREHSHPLELMACRPLVGCVDQGALLILLMRLGRDEVFVIIRDILPIPFLVSKKQASALNEHA